ncbi:Cytosolic sulfotransferase 15 [Bienertia sinuspersici]
MIQYQSFWFPGYRLFKNTLKSQKHFKAKDTDLIIASHPKTGTTWLNALLFAIVNRDNGNHPMNESPILSQHPHHLVNRLEDVNFGGGFFNQLSSSQLDDLPSPRLFSTHIPYVTLSESIKTCDGCRILYICRNPFDTFVSQWHFYNKVVIDLDGEQTLKPYTFEQFFEDWFEGRILFGPFFEHVIDYWMQSLANPKKVLFLKYEDLKENPTIHLKRIADFVEMPFSLEEESRGVIREIIDMCSINNMKKLDVNKNGLNYSGVEKKAYFRKGEVGGWINYFTPPMIERMDRLMQQKLQGTGLTFKLISE